MTRTTTTMNDPRSDLNNLLKVHSRVVLLLALQLVFGTAVFSQTEKPQQNTYFLRHQLIFLKEEAPHVSPSRIVFTERSICNFDESVYDGRILNRNSEVEMISIDKESNPAKAEFRFADKRFEILLANSTDNEFRKSFDLVFSEKERKIGYPKRIKTWRDLVKAYGFPISSCRSESDKEKWFYIVEFSNGACGSFDGCWVSVSEEGLEIEGYN